MKVMSHKIYAYARILLAVFLPMLLCSMIHVHQEAAESTATCDACQHHMQHHSHLVDLHNATDHCVLCQFLSSPFVGGITTEVAPTHTDVHASAVHWQSVYNTFFTHPFLNRGPPTLL